MIDHLCINPILWIPLLVGMTVVLLFCIQHWYLGFCIQHWFLGFVYNTGTFCFVYDTGLWVWAVFIYNYSNALVFTLILLYLMYVQRYTQYYDFVIIKYYSIHVISVIISFTNGI